MMDLAAGIVLVAGSVFVMLAGVGVIRFPHIYARMHAAAKGPTLGVILIGIGTALAIRTTEASIEVALVIALQLIAGPVGTHILGRSVYRTVRHPLEGPDELAEAEDDEPADQPDRPG